MADKEQSSDNSGRASHAERPTSGASGRTGLSNILVKSPQWKKNTLRRIENLRSGDPTGARHADLLMHEKRGEEIELLRQAIAELESENARMAAEHRHELDANKAELRQLQAAYDQFEQQSDVLLNELEQQNERLRDECKRQNRRSVL